MYTTKDPFGSSRCANEKGREQRNESRGSSCRNRGGITDASWPISRTLSRDRMHVIRRTIPDSLTGPRKPERFFSRKYLRYRFDTFVSMRRENFAERLKRWPKIGTGSGSTSERHGKSKWYIFLHCIFNVAHKLCRLRERCRTFIERNIRNS